MTLKLAVEFERERPGRWIAEIVALPGVMAYGTTRRDAFRRAQALALEVIADRLKRGENPRTGRASRAGVVDGIDFTAARAV